MARTDNDSWEITESVGATALGVASSRAAETRSENPLIRDPFAQVFLDAAGDGVWNWHSSGQLPPEVIEAEPLVPLQMQAMVGYMACRTAFFDNFFLDATRVGDPAGGDPGGRIGRAVVAVAVAGRGDGLRARPAQGAGLQGIDVGRARGRAGLSIGSRSRWTCVRTGRRRCSRRVLTLRRRASGRPKG